MDTLSLQGQEIEMQAVRFPLPAGSRRARRGLWRMGRLAGLLPERWRRRVVIGGMSFWRPG